jgi:hypothetical protein
MEASTDERKPMKEKYREIVPVSNSGVAGGREGAPCGTCRTMRKVVAVGRNARSMTPK